MWPNSPFPGDLVKFTEEILKGWLYFLCKGYDEYFIFLVQGKKYFKCLPNYGIFVRQTKLTELKSDSKLGEASQSPKSRITSPSSASKTVGLRKPVSESHTSQVCLTIWIFYLWKGTFSPTPISFKLPGHCAVSNQLKHFHKSIP